MRDSWVATKLGLVSEFVMGQAPLGERCNKDGIGTPFVKAGEFEENRPKIVEWTTDPLKMAKSSDVLVCVVGATAGKINLGANCAIGRSVAAVRPGKDLHQFYLYYLLSLELSNLRSGSRGSAQGVITKDDLYRIAITLPPLSEQKRIVDLISSVDSYIEALQQQLESAKRSRNAVLHELLTAGGDDWVETTLDGIAEYINGYPFKPADLGEVGLPVIRIKQLLDSNEPLDRTEIATPERCLLRDGDIVFSWSGTLAVRIWSRGPAKLNQHLFRVVEKKGVYKGIIPLILDHAIEELEEKSHGTTMKHITKQTLLPHKVLLPPLAEQIRIVEMMSSADEVVNKTDFAINHTKNLRSGLLSELLSGEHEIPASYDKVIGAA
jgi:restriction endonuclease S subunit